MGESVKNRNDPVLQRNFPDPKISWMALFILILYITEEIRLEGYLQSEGLSV